MLLLTWNDVENCFVNTVGAFHVGLQFAIYEALLNILSPPDSLSMMCLVRCARTFLIGLLANLLVASKNGFIRQRGTVFR